DLSAPIYVQRGLPGLPPQFSWYCEYRESDFLVKVRDLRSFLSQSCQVNQKAREKLQGLKLRREGPRWTRILRRPPEPVHRAGPHRAAIPFLVERCSNPYRSE